MQKTLTFSGYANEVGVQYKSKGKGNESQHTYNKTKKKHTENKTGTKSLRSALDTLEGESWCNHSGEIKKKKQIPKRYYR